MLGSAFDRLAPEVHWFCPTVHGKSTNNDVGPVKQEDADPRDQGGTSIAASFEKREAAFRYCLRVYSYDSDDAAPFKKQVQLGIERNLSRCDDCTVGYYRSKHRWMEELRGYV